jgi:DNA-binding transcriptional regulator YhcF (GntR family)
MHPNTIKKYINRLEGLGIIYKDKKSKKELHFLDKKSLASLLN